MGQLLIPCILITTFLYCLYNLTKTSKIISEQTCRENIIFIGVSIKISYSFKWNNEKEAAIDVNGGS